MNLKNSRKKGYRDLWIRKKLNEGHRVKTVSCGKHESKTDVKKERIQLQVFHILKIEEMVQMGNRKGRSELKATHITVNGLTSALAKLNDYLRESKPDIMGVVKTK